MVSASGCQQHMNLHCQQRASTTRIPLSGLIRAVRVCIIAGPHVLPRKAGQRWALD